MAFDTSLTRMLGLDLPIVQAPIGGQSNPHLAAAVSNAGGLGTLALTWTEPEDVGRVIRQTKQLTDRPFGVNLALQWPQHDRLAICIAERVPLVSLFWGDPAPYVDPIHAGGARLALTVASAEQAREAVDVGADLVVAQGWEAGGHVLGEVATLPLVPAVVDAVPVGVPVIAAGGFADGRGLAAALALGAAGVWMGTRFVMAQESLGHDRYRALIAAARETDTFYSTLFDIGWPDAPHRTLRNSTVEAWIAAGSPVAGSRPGEGELLARTTHGEEVVRYSSAAPLATLEGRIEALSLWAGQSAGLISDVRPAADIVADIATQALEVIGKLMEAAGRHRGSATGG